MSFFRSIFAQPQTRSENGGQVVSLNELLVALGLDGNAMSLAGETVNEEIALSVTPLNAGITFIAEQIASLPLELYSNDADGRQKAAKDPLYYILHDEINEDKVTSFQWRKQSIINLKLYGADYTFIERNPKTGRISNLWPLDPTKTKRRLTADNRRFYEEKRGSKTHTYQPHEIIDFVDKLKPNRKDHYSPVKLNKDTIGLARAVERYASTAFHNNGVPPMQLVCTLPEVSPEAHASAIAVIYGALKQGMAEGKQFLPLPPGYELKPMGFDPEKMQMLNVKASLLVSFGQMLNLPPVFLQDLSKGTYSNTEQQGTMLVKNTLAPLTVMMQQELNAKLIKRSASTIEFNLDGVMRGDFKGRMEGIVSALRGGLMTPNEGRKLINLPPKEGGDELFMQGADRPITDLGNEESNTDSPPEDAGGEEQ